MKTRNTSRFTFVAILLLFLSYPTYGYDRGGSDIDNPKVSTPTECAALCDGDPRCRSWTFVRPPIKHPTSPVCFLKDAVPEPSIKSPCPSNIECLSGVKDSRGQWCGENPRKTVSGELMGQGDVVDCPSGLTCRPIVTIPPKAPLWCIFVLWIPKVCQPSESLSTIDYFCQ